MKVIQMYLFNISNDILEFIFKFLSDVDKLNLIKVNKKLIDNFKIDGIKIHINLRSLLIIDDDLFYLKGVHTIDLFECDQITDQGLQYLADESALLIGDKLKGVHTINLSACEKITNQGLQYLMGVHTINLSACEQITDQGLQYLTGVHTN